MSDTSNHYIGHDPENEEYDSILNTMKDAARVIGIFLAIVLLFGLCSCKSHVCGVGETVWMHDTIHHVTNHRDSIYLHDSVYFETRHEGDTVFITKDRWHTSYKDRLLHDSIYIHRTDTVLQRVEVPAKLTRLQTFEQTMGRVFIVLMAMVLFVIASVLIMRKVLR